MAKYIENFKSKLDWSNVLQRTAAVPLDRTELFESLADATLYAQGGADARNLSGTSYIGQIVVVHENDAVTAYIIENKVAESFDAEGKETNKSTRTLKELAGAEAAAGDVESALKKLNDHITAYTTKVKELEDADKAIMGELGEDEERAYASLIELERALKQEVTDRGTADRGLQNSLDGEKTRAVAAEQGLQNAIDSVSTDLEAFMGANEGAMESVNDAIEAAKQEALDAVAGEQKRAEGVEARLAGRLDVIEGEEEGSIKKAVADAKAEIKEAAGVLEGRVKANEDKLAGLEQATVKAEIQAAQTAAEKHADNAITALVDSAPDAMNTLNELAKAINDNKGIYDAWVEQHNQAMATMKSDLTKDINDAVAGEKSRAEGKEAKLLDAINKEVQERTDAIAELKQTHDSEMDAAEERIAALEAKFGGDAEDGTVESQIAAAKQELEGKITAEVTRAEGQEAAIRREFAAADAALKQELQAEIDTDVKVVADELANQKDATKDGSLAKQIATEKSRAEAAEQGLQKSIDSVSSDLESFMESNESVMEGVNEAIASAKQEALDAVADEQERAEGVEARIEGLVTTLRTDTVAVFNALELVGEEKDNSIEISLVLNGGAAMNNVTTPLGTVALDVMSEAEVTDMLIELGITEEE